MEETVIISLGGSLIIPNEVDVEFLKGFKSLILSQVVLGKKFLIITGGGKTARVYQNAAKEISTPSSRDLDWIGIASLRVNAELLRVMFGEVAYEKVINDSKDLNSGIINSIIIGGSREPGRSSDGFAMEVVESIGVKRLINLSNIDYAYDKDPNKFPDAKKIEHISWADYRALIPAEWDPGLNTPFDPTASKIAEAEGVEVAILNGKNIANLEKCLNGEEFIGTRIQ